MSHSNLMTDSGPKSRYDSQYIRNVITFIEQKQEGGRHGMVIWVSVLRYFEGSGQWTIHSGNFRSKKKKSQKKKTWLYKFSQIQSCLLEINSIICLSTQLLFFHRVNTLICSYSFILLMFYVVMYITSLNKASQEKVMIHFVHRYKMM